MFVETIQELLERGKYVKAPNNNSIDSWMEFIQKNLQEKSRRALPDDGNLAMPNRY